MNTTDYSLIKVSIDKYLEKLSENRMTNTPIKQTALITGATSGIGAEYARRLAADGYNLIITGRREAKIKALADELSNSFGNDVEVILVELSDSAQVDGLIENIKDRGIHLLINNAGFGTTKFFSNTSFDLYEKMIRVHILAHMKIVYAILPGMLKKRAGVIINVSSAGAFLPSPKTVVYSGTKAFQVAFTESLYMELEGTGIQVQVVCPGLTKTDMHVRLGIPEDRIINWGPFQWNSPQKVVECSLRCLKKKKILCLPGRLNRMQVFMRRLVPESLYYKTTGRYFHKYGWTDEV
jgi:short-subunit dehydrogenase